MLILNIINVMTWNCFLPLPEISTEAKNIGCLWHVLLTLSLALIILQFLQKIFILNTLNYMTWNYFLRLPAISTDEVFSTTPNNCQKERYLKNACFLIYSNCNFGNSNRRIVTITTRRHPRNCVPPFYNL